MRSNIIIGTISVLLVLGVFWAVWPETVACNGPRYTINEQVYRGQTVFWLRRLKREPWPFCSYRLESPALFYSVEEARAAAAERSKRVDTDERVVATVP